MQVTYVCTDPGIPVFGTKGASVHVQEVLRVLVGRGHDVTLHAARTGGPAPDGLVEVEVHEHGRPRGEDAATAELAACAADDTLEARLTAAPSPDLVYERYTLWGGAGIRAAARAGVPSVLEVNAPLIDEQADHRVLVDRAGAERRARTTFAAATAVVCVSDAVAAWVRERTAAPDRVHVVPNGVDVDRIRPGDARDPAAFTVGFVGNLRPWHGVEALIHALGHLRRSVPAARLLLVGDGPDRDDLLQLAGHLEVPVEHTGRVEPADVPPFLHRMDVATVPTPGDTGRTYFSPLKLFEYLAAGLPVVATDVGQTAAVLEHGRAGLLVPPGDHVAFATALRTVATRPAIGRRLRRRARTLATTRHTWARTVERSLTAAGVGRHHQIRPDRDPSIAPPPVAAGVASWSGCGEVG